MRSLVEVVPNPALNGSDSRGVMQFLDQLSADRCWSKENHRLPSVPPFRCGLREALALFVRSRYIESGDTAMKAIWAQLFGPLVRSKCRPRRARHFWTIRERIMPLLAKGRGVLSIDEREVGPKDRTACQAKDYIPRRRSGSWKLSPQERALLQHRKRLKSVEQVENGSWGAKLGGSRLYLRNQEDFSGSPDFVECRASSPAPSCLVIDASGRGTFPRIRPPMRPRIAERGLGP